MRSLSLCAMAVLAVGCGDTLGVEVVVTERVPEYAAIEVALAAGCADQPEDGSYVAAPTRAVLIDADGASTAFGSVDPGRYGLVARAWDDGCAVVGWGCAEVEVAKTTDVLSVELAELAGGCTAPISCRPSGGCSD